MKTLATENSEIEIQLLLHNKQNKIWMGNQFLKSVAESPRMRIKSHSEQVEPRASMKVMGSAARKKKMCMTMRKIRTITLRETKEGARRCNTRMKITVKVMTKGVMA